MITVVTNAKVNSAVEVCSSYYIFTYFSCSFIGQFLQSWDAMFFLDELISSLHSSPMGWGQGCELFLLQKKIQNTRRCCLWSSLNFLHLWNSNGFTFSSFRKILRAVSLEKSNFLAIWQIEEMGFSSISWLICCFTWEVALEIWLPG